MIPYDFPSDGQHLHVVMLYALMGAIHIMAKPCTNAPYLITRNDRADARAAKDDSSLRLSIQYGLANTPCNIGKVHHIRRIAPMIRHFMLFFYKRNNPPLHCKTAMIRSNCNFHRHTSTSCRPYGFMD